MTAPRCPVCNVDHSTSTLGIGAPLDLPERQGGPMAEQGTKERRWVNRGTERRPNWGLYEMYPADRRYAGSLPWVPGEPPGGKPGRVDADEPAKPETPHADNKAVTPGPVRAPRKATKATAKKPKGE
jgi:hypothetical protein